MSDTARDEFLADAKIAILATPADGPPLAVPVWFEWSDGRARFFSSASSPKMKRLARDPRASLLVANPAGEPERWVLIQGAVEVSEDGGFDLAERLAHRYWDMSDAGHAQTVEDWRGAAATLRVLEIVPGQIRSSG
jgi:PPOX class probable F420-dependent enzyme